VQACAELNSTEWLRGRRERLRKVGWRTPDALQTRSVRVLNCPWASGKRDDSTAFVSARSMVVNSSSDCPMPADCLVPVQRRTPHARCAGPHRPERLWSISCKSSPDCRPPWSYAHRRLTDQRGGSTELNRRNGCNVISGVASSRRADPPSASRWAAHLREVIRRGYPDETLGRDSRQLGLDLCAPIAYRHEPPIKLTSLESAGAIGGNAIRGSRGMCSGMWCGSVPTKCSPAPAPRS
jgi:hypothetical protein